MSLVSIIVPCYRDAATLGRALRSIFAQTYRNLEVIVVNDCSPETDRIEAVLRDFPAVRSLRNPRNLGLAATRNAGVEAATGEIVAFLDADDEYHPQKIELQLAALPAGGAITCRTLDVSVNGQQAAGLPFLTRMPACTRMRGPRSIVWRNTLNGAGLLASRTLLRRFGGYDATLRSCEDFDLWLRLLEAEVPICRLESPLYVYHFNAAGLSKNVADISRWELDAVTRHLARMAAHGCLSWPDGLIRATWLARHLYRSELHDNVELRMNTLDSARRMTDHPFLSRALVLAGSLRLLHPLALCRRK